jgi:excisionase family DNA binding protein
MTRTLDVKPAFATVKEAALYLRMSRSTVYELIAQGAIPVVKFGPCLTRIRWSWLEEQNTKALGA